MTTDGKVTATQRPATLTPFREHLAAGATCHSRDEESSSYNSMQVTAQPHLTQGLTAKFTYASAEEIDDVSPTSSQLGALAGSILAGNQHRFAVNLQQTNKNSKLIAPHSFQRPVELSLCEGIIQ